MTTTVVEAAGASTPVPADSASSWQRVVREIRSSCAKRAGAGQLYASGSAVGVLAGAAPVIWVHGEADVAALTGTLAAAPDVADVYVATCAPDTAEALQASGWREEERMTQVVRERDSWVAREPWPAAVRELGPADLPAFRRALAAGSGADGLLLASSYGDDFFERAHPAWLLGAYAGPDLVGTIGLRLQHEGAMAFALSVDPEHRGSGVAHDLVRAALILAFGQGATFVHALTGAGSLAVARSCGARPVGGWLHLVRDRDVRDRDVRDRDVRDRDVRDDQVSE